MRYVITGHTGFLGRNLLERLQKDPSNEFLVIGRNYSLIDKISDFNPDYIYHYAAEIYDESKMLESNIILTHRLLEATKYQPYRGFINIGSSSEYGNINKPRAEKDVLTPNTMYEATKGSATLLCQAYASIYDKPIVTIRPFSVYGRYEKEHRFIPTLLRKFINKEPITVSPGVHDFIHVDDFTDGVLKIAESSDMKKDIVNLGTGVQYTNLEVYELFCILFGYKIELTELKTKLRTFDTECWVADTTYAETKYNIKPKYDLLTGLKQYYAETTKQEITRD
jgi:nucleoside-diphosphate-sugar epimerase